MSPWHNRPNTAPLRRERKSEDLDRAGRAKRLRRMQHLILISIWSKNNHRNIITELAHSAETSLTAMRSSGSSVRRKTCWGRAESFHRLLNPRDPWDQLLISIRSPPSFPALLRRWAPSQDKVMANTCRQPLEVRPRTRTRATASSRTRTTKDRQSLLRHNLQRLPPATPTVKASSAFKRHRRLHLLHKVRKMCSLPPRRRMANTSTNFNSSIWITTRIGRMTRSTRA